MEVASPLSHEAEAKARPVRPLEAPALIQDHAATITTAPWYSFQIHTEWLFSFILQHMHGDCVFMSFVIV